MQEGASNYSWLQHNNVMLKGVRFIILGFFLCEGPRLKVFVPQTKISDYHDYPLTILTIHPHDYPSDYPADYPGDYPSWNPPGAFP